MSAYRIRRVHRLGCYTSEYIPPKLLLRGKIMHSHTRSLVPSLKYSGSTVTFLITATSVNLMAVNGEYFRTEC
jgi:hypothetical protein